MVEAPRPDPVPQGRPAASHPALAMLRDLVSDHGDRLTFAMLGAPLLEDLAIGWSGGRPLAASAAEMLTRVDGISAEGRDRQLAGRAALTLAARRGARVDARTPGDRVFLLGDPEGDEGDPEAERALARRDLEYVSLSRYDAALTAAEYAAAAAGAFVAARGARADPPPDRLAEEHALALLGLTLPRGLRAWFHAQYGPTRADALAWKFVLVSRALARHHQAMTASGVLPAGADAPVPAMLLTALLALDLGELAKTAVVEP